MRDESVKKAAETLDEFVNANEKENGYAIFAANSEGCTISISGSEASVICALAWSIRKKNEFGKLLDKAIKFNLHMMIEELGNMKESKKDQTNE